MVGRWGEGWAISGEGSQCSRPPRWPVRRLSPGRSRLFDVIIRMLGSAPARTGCLSQSRLAQQARLPMSSPDTGTARQRVPALAQLSLQASANASADHRPGQSSSAQGRAVKRGTSPVRGAVRTCATGLGTSQAAAVAGRALRLTEMTRPRGCGFRALRASVPVGEFGLPPPLLGTSSR